MAKLLVTISIILAIANLSNTSALPKNDSKNVKVQFATPEEIKELLKQYPNAIELKPEVQQIKDEENMERTIGVPIFNLHYWIGQRSPLDSPAATDTNAFSWPFIRDLDYTLNYPLQGIGKIITFVDIYVRQTSQVGRVYVVSGGPGFRQISFVIEALATSVFEYQAIIYGLN